MDACLGWLVVCAWFVYLFVFITTFDISVRIKL